MKPLRSIYLLLIGIAGWMVPAFAESEYDVEDEVLALAREYVFTLHNYVNASSSEDADYFLLELFPLFEETVLYHYNDLPGEEGYRKIEFHRYISLIEEKYRHRLKMEMTEAEEVELIDCVERKDGEVYYTVTFPKRFVYDGRTAEVENVIKIKLVGGRPLINIIGMPEHIPPPQSCAKDRSRNVNNNEQREKVRRYLEGAERAFGAGDYVAAQDGFEAALVLAGDAAEKARIEDRIRLCQQRLDAVQFVQTGDRYFAKHDYGTAETYYRRALAYDSGYPELRSKIAKCQERITAFNNFLARGDRYYRDRNFRSALDMYEKALAYQPDYTYCSQRIKQCREAIEYPQRVANELAEARRLRDQGKHRDALLLFNKHKSSGQLKAIDFYYLGQALYANKRNVQGRFGYSRKEAMAVAADYLNRAKCMGSSGARNFINEYVSLRLRKLLKSCSR